MVITRRIFTEALAQLAQWDSQRVGMRKMRLSLNLTPRVVGARDVTPWLKELLEANDIDPARLTLELTESALVSAPSAIVDKMTELRNLGMQISLDDFGTGYSTLSRLMQLPVSELKIDRAFTQSDEASHRAIVPGVIRLARDSGLTVVAEGIETQEQLDVLLSEGVDLGQGYLFSRPIAGELIPDFVRSAEEVSRSLINPMP
ncbi:MAG: EAL domain-containing protein [Actinobacteria bacterium]|nr:EAL domain-containing protein [Actinomycetota bacterium]